MRFPAKGIGLKKLFIGVLAFTVWIPGLSMAQIETNSKSPNLFVIQWQGSVFSWEREGVACWVADSAGNLRFEMLVGEQLLYPDYLDRLMNWSGFEGYTTISTSTGEGTFSRWNESWQSLPPALNTWLRVLLGTMDPEGTRANIELPSGVRELTFWGRPLTSVKFISNNHKNKLRRLQVPGFKLESQPGVVPEKSFRSELSYRGRGRGGQQTIITLSGDASTAGGVRINSTHQPGTLVLSQLQVLSASYQPEEVFLPWWPLSGYVVLDK